MSGRETFIAVAFAGAIGAGACLADAGAAEFELSLSETGKRDYYCTVTLTVTNTTDDVVLDEINGRVMLRIGEEPVGRSKGASLLTAPPGGTASATFETPDAPCDEVDNVHFVVGICRIEGDFVGAAECAPRIGAVAPVSAIVSR